jgi:hypothetical protein
LHFVLKRFLNIILIFNLVFFSKFCSANLISLSICSFLSFLCPLIHIFVLLSHYYILLVLTLVHKFHFKISILSFSNAYLYSSECSSLEAFPFLSFFKIVSSSSFLILSLKLVLAFTVPILCPQFVSIHKVLK